LRRWRGANALRAKLRRVVYEPAYRRRVLRRKMLRREQAAVNRILRCKQGCVTFGRA
jgi:hypothetical protein